MEEDVRVDKEKGNNLWRESMDKEMTNNSIVFDAREEGEEPPRRYKEMAAHMNFDVHLDSGFTCKARFVSYG